MSKSPQTITDKNLIKRFSQLTKVIDLQNPDLQKVYYVIDEYAEYLKLHNLDKSNDIEVYSPIIADIVILKARISDRTKTTIKYDYSMFHINGDESKELYVASSHVKTQDIAKVLKQIFSDIKAFIVFDKFNLSENNIFDNDSAFNKIMSNHYQKHSPVSYDNETI